jgi:hypothetical protein
LVAPGFKTIRDPSEATVNALGKPRLNPLVRAYCLGNESVIRAFRGGDPRTLAPATGTGRLATTSDDLKSYDLVWLLHLVGDAHRLPIDRLLDQHTYRKIAAILNERGMSSGEGKPFTVRSVARIKRNYCLTPRYDRLRKAGMLTVEEMAVLLGIRPQSVKIWKRYGLIRGHAYNDKNDCLYEHPGDNPPRKAQGIKLSQRRPAAEVVAQRTEEVQCEA